jgi:hypothetical protein
MYDEDRRAHIRYPVSVNVTLHTAEGKDIQVASRDFSAGGVFLKYSPTPEHPLALHDKVRVTVHYEDTGESESVYADVVRVEEAGIGLRFDRSKPV